MILPDCPRHRDQGRNQWRFCVRYENREQPLCKKAERLSSAPRLERAIYGFEVQEIGFLPVITDIYIGRSLLIISEGCRKFACRRLIRDDPAVRHLHGHHEGGRFDPQW